MRRSAMRTTLFHVATTTNPATIDPRAGTL